MKWIFFCLPLLLAGCSSQPIDYYWGDYSKTLFELKKFPSEDAELAHISSMEDILTESEQRGFRPPPGVQAELAYRYANRGDKNRASELFARELQAYPESEFFVQRLMQSLGI